jgi:hypothetical protein
MKMRSASVPRGLAERGFPVIIVFWNCAPFIPECWEPPPGIIAPPPIPINAGGTVAHPYTPKMFERPSVGHSGCEPFRRLFQRKKCSSGCERI